MIVHPPPAPDGPRDDRAAAGDGALDGFPPRCASCLQTLEPTHLRATGAWICPGCGLIRIA